MSTNNNPFKELRETIAIDVMRNNGRSFYKTLHYNWCSLFKFNMNELERMLVWVFEQVPSAKQRSDVVLFVRMPSGEELEVKTKHLANENNKKPIKRVKV